MRPYCLLAALALAALLAQPSIEAEAAEPAEMQAMLFADASTAFRALVMLAQGRTLFGSDWSASPDQRRRWNALVVDGLNRRVEGDDGAAE